MTLATEPCPNCNALAVEVDYRIAVRDAGEMIYRATCESCGAALALPVNPDDLRKMVPLRSH